MNKSFGRTDFALMAKMRMVIVVALALMLVLAMSLSVFAGSVTYEGGAEGFVFSPGSSSSPTDMFTGLKDVMPGDTLTEEIEVKNNSGETKTIYMRALGASQEDKDFLSQMNLVVKTSGGETIFDSSADQTAGLTTWVDIGNYSSGSSKVLSLELTVPIELGNEYQNATGDVNWQFMTEEEIPDEPAEIEEGDGSGNSSGGTKTGDETNLALPLAVIVITAAGVVLIRRRKRSE